MKIETKMSKTSRNMSQRRAETIETRIEISCELINDRRLDDHKSIGLTEFYTVADCGCCGSVVLSFFFFISFFLANFHWLPASSKVPMECARLKSNTQNTCIRARRTHIYSILRHLHSRQRQRRYTAHEWVNLVFT